MSKDYFIRALHKALPPVFTRQIAASITGLSVGTHRNLDCLDKGPARHRSGKYTYYERESYIQWFLNRAEDEGVRDEE